jgi:hypothetical protein
MWQGGVGVPRITTDFDGYTVFINYDDHPPPHFDVRGNGHHCRFSIETGEPLDDSCRMPKAMKARMRIWAGRHRQELYVNWRHAQAHERLHRINVPG